MIVNVTKGDRKYKVRVPDGAPQALWQAGIIIGPPDLSELGLPVGIETRLHNELFSRGLITKRDVRKRMSDVYGALQAALQVDATTVASQFKE